MYCERCGENNANGAKFCQKCGAEMPIPTKPPKSIPNPLGSIKRRIDFREFGAKIKAFLSRIINKKTLFALAAAAVIIILIVVAIDIANPNPYHYPKMVSSYGYDSDSDQTTIAIEGETEELTIDGWVTDSASNYTESVSLFRTYEGDLYYVSNSKAEIRTVAYDVDWFLLSPDGSAVAYYDEVLEELYLYRFSDGVRILLADGPIYRSEIAISPDGCAVAFYNDQENKTYLYTDDNQEYIGKDLIPIALSADAKYLYVREKDTNTLYSYTKKNGTTKVSSNVDFSDPFLLNQDGTEVIYTSTKGHAYLMKNAANPIELMSVSNRLDVLLPQSADSYYIQNNDRSTFFHISSFKGQLLVDRSYIGLRYNYDGDVYYLRSLSKWEKIASSVNCARIARNSKTITYIKNGVLYRLNKHGGTPEEVAENAKDAYTSSDGNKVYYINYSDELWYTSGKGKEVFIADDATDVVVSENGTVFFLTSDIRSDWYELYSYQNGRQPKMQAEDVESLIQNGKYILAFTNYHNGIFDIYVSNGKSNMSPLLESIEQ